MNKKSIALKRGFTLIELLLVIAILGVLSAAVVIAINPTKRLAQANDTKVKSDMQQIATGLSSYYTENSFYPLTLAELTASLDLKSIPVPPSTYTTYPTYQSGALIQTAAGGACTTALKNCTNVRLYQELKSPKVTGNGWCWRSETGAATETTLALCTI